MVAYADHGVVVFDRPDGTTKQHWPRHRARARVVYCSRPPNTHLTTHLNSPTSLLRRHHLLLNSPTGATARGSLQPFHYICRVAFVHSSDKTQHSTHSLTHSPCCALWRPDAHTRGLVRLRYDDRSFYCPRLLYTTHLQTNFPEAMPGALAEGRTYTRGDGYNYS